MTTQRTARAFQLAARPHGFPTADLFTVEESPVPEPAPGTAVVENVYLSVDPYHRELMDEGGWELGVPLEGRAIGRVTASRAPGLTEGDLVFHRAGWRTHAVVTPGEGGVRTVPSYDGVPLAAHLSILGGTGLTAYVALTRTLEFRAGQDLFVSAAAGGVGTAVARIARLLGAGRLIGSAGTPEKVARLTGELGFDAAFDYHDGPVGELLAKAAPDGIDAYVDNVGGDHLEGAISVLRDHGRIAWVGAISQYHSAHEPPAAPRNLFDIVGKSLRLEGVLVRDYGYAQAELEALLVPHLQSGLIAPDVTVVDGFDRTVDGFFGMLRGENTGKMLIKIAD
ncbi:NADP-dependent oxidoreductase [Streptomyces fimicarius]|uniref:NADP-dependent oxidoreductase n=1 Tax=Streptomyces caviscabies TaxID=90079 RepID=A0ABW2M9M4_9ACTN|nr:MULTISPECIES: NADP-dependent oxidoreductase [Streptomyces]MCL6291802.1 NADP-dependent oxidoreductase [Streptomyces sp. 43Y-GA-1]MCX4711878.1 NADP-dependent oxidoreductase [Streptomyces griseus]MDX2670417.1 NADP-dependent oxidoreductase [Streptomyces sp. NRRL_ISP-5395]MDX3340933.1 NADP-dependent oxidoreductase [Streptomyces sp. ME02-6979.5a]MDX3505391.1 NADP-dependent oxidoreductase [Streptomyces sp. ATCC51928]